MRSSILLVTEPGHGTPVSRVLEESGYRVQVCHTAAAAYQALERFDIDLILIDPIESEVDPAAMVVAMRTRTSAPIVLIDSGAQDELDRVLAAGAGDFLAKPFSPAQLQARVAVALAAGRKARAVIVGDIRIDLLRRRAWLNGTALQLSRREFDLLHFLAEHMGEVVSRRELATAVWPHSVTESTSDLSRTMDVHLSWLRRKLGDTAAHPRYLHTVHGVGFKLVGDIRKTP